jgi:hypothetical protein
VPSSRRRAGVVVLLVLGLALAGCGSAEIKSKPAAPQGADPAAWVGAFCGGLGDVIAADGATAKSQPTPQGQKDGLLKLAESTQQAFTNTAHKLTQLGQPGITDGKRVQDIAVGFFTTAAGAVSGQRAKLIALDVNDPDFAPKADQLAGPDLGAAGTQLQGLTSNKELAPAFVAAPECQRLVSAGQR